MATTISNLASGSLPMNCGHGRKHSEVERVKAAVARHLRKMVRLNRARMDYLERFKREKLVLDWRKRQQARAQVRVTIETVLDERLPDAYTADLYETKSAVVYEHIYECYYGAGKSIYGSVA